MKLWRGVGWQHNLRMDNAALAGVVMGHAVPLVYEFRAAAVCDSTNGRFALAALYHFEGAMKNGDKR